MRPSLALRMVAALARWPRLAAAAKRVATEHLIPFNRALGIRIVRITADSGEVVLRLPAKRRNLNVGGTVHGGAIMALAETVHGVAVMWQFPPPAHRMVTKHADIRFLAPARGPLSVGFSLPTAMLEGIRKSLEAGARSDVTLSCRVTDATGQAVAELTATYAIRRVEGG